MPTGSHRRMHAGRQAQPRASSPRLKDQPPMEMSVLSAGLRPFKACMAGGHARGYAWLSCWQDRKIMSIRSTKSQRTCR